MPDSNRITRSRIGYNSENLLPLPGFVQRCHAAMDADWNLAPSAKRGEGSALRRDREPCSRIVQEGNCAHGSGIVFACLNAKRPLPGGRTKLIRFQPLAQPLGFLKTIKAGSRQQNGIDLSLGKFAQP